MFSYKKFSVDAQRKPVMLHAKLLKKNEVPKTTVQLAPIMSQNPSRKHLATH